ncbi:MAG: glycosyltransferase family 4 protein, partial [Acidobacteriota bacterium]|nr:glycosyltransferase family 4 protein [Acidobacteriota bacterium]
MRVVYILNGTALYGGVKVVFQHAQILRRLGVDAEVVSPEPAPYWFAGAEAFYRQLNDLSSEAIGPADIAVGTIYYTVPIAERVAQAVAVHLCQCWEGSYEPIRDEWPLIDQIYRHPTVKLAVSPHLAKLIEEHYQQPCAWIPQPLDTDLFHPPTFPRPADGNFRVLVTGRWDLEVKGVERALRALRPLMPELELVRLAQGFSEEEIAFWPEAERHAAVLPTKVPELLRSVDAYVSVSSEVEGFGLPTLEAMSCGRAAIVSDIGAHRAMDPDALAALRVPVGDPEALRSAVRKLRDDAPHRARLGREGRRIAETFSEERTGRALMEVFERVTVCRP